MKVAIIAFNNIRISPYIAAYSDLLKDKDVDCHLIYPNRQGIDEEFWGKTHRIPWSASKCKIFNFLTFRKHAKKILKREKFDFVFVLTTMPAVLLSDVLLKYYKGKYSVDVRDHTREGIRAFYHFEKKVINSASFAVISSPYFKNFLPKFEYKLCHNLASQYKTPQFKFVPKVGKIIIGYVGVVAYANTLIPVIDLVRGDDRFELHIYGKENNPSEPVGKHVASCNCDRIKYFGAYASDKKPEILGKVDILFNAYGNASSVVKYALSNKLYDSFYYKKPLLVSERTAMQNETGSFSFGISGEETNLDSLWDWYHGINGVDFNAYADAYLDRARKDNEEFARCVLNVIERSGMIKE